MLKFKPLQRVNMDIDPEIWKKIGILAIKKGTTKRAVVEKALIDIIEANKTSTT